MADFGQMATMTFPDWARLVSDYSAYYSIWDLDLVRTVLDSMAAYAAAAADVADADADEATVDVAAADVATAAVAVATTMPYLVDSTKPDNLN